MTRIEEIEQRMAAIEDEPRSPVRIETNSLGDATMRVNFDVSYPMYQVLAHAPFDISYLLEQVREAADALEAAERRVARLETAAAAAVRWFEDVKPHLEGQAGFLHVHGMNYEGRTDAPEIFAALAALDEVEP